MLLALSHGTNCQRRKLVKRNCTLNMMPMVFLLVLLAAPLSNGAALADTLVIKGDGSTFAYPMYSKWIEEYEKDDPAVRLTYMSNGSGAGIHDIMMGTVDFAGTDGPLNKTQMLDFSTHHNCEVLHFPTALEPTFPSITYRESSKRLTSPRRPSRAYILEQLRNGTTPRSPNLIRTYRCPPTILRLSIGRTEAEPPTCGPTI